MNSYYRLYELGRDFISVATTYGRIIILESYIENKTIYPVNNLGVAGGQKYYIYISSIFSKSPVIINLIFV
jgi:hypothetical protein